MKERFARVRRKGDSARNKHILNIIYSVAIGLLLRDLVVNMILLCARLINVGIWSIKIKDV